LCVFIMRTTVESTAISRLPSTFSFLATSSIMGADSVMRSLLLLNPVFTEIMSFIEVFAIG
jgi:hypothetical protein